MPTFLFSMAEKNRPSAVIDVFLSGVTVLPRRVLAASSPTKSHCWGFEPVEPRFGRSTVVPLSFGSLGGDVHSWARNRWHPPAAATAAVEGSTIQDDLKLLSRSVAALFGEGLREIAVDLLFLLVVILGIPIKCKVKLRQIAKTKRHLFTISLDL